MSHHDPGQPEQEARESTIEFVGATHSLAREEVNEDIGTLLASGEGAFVLDGMGGHENGAEASRIAGEAIERVYAGVTLESNMTVASDRMRSALAQAHAAVKIFNRSTDSDSGATCAIAHHVKSPEHGDTMLCGSIGDCRVYHVSGGAISQVTIDNYQGEEDKDVSVLRAEQARQSELLDNTTAADQTYFNKRNFVSGALGFSIGSPQLFHVPVKPGDRIIITSDGVHDNLTTTQIAGIVGGSEDPAATAQWLTMTAKQIAGGSSPRSKTDDMTAVVLDVRDATQQSRGASLAAELDETTRPRGQRVEEGIETTRPSVPRRQWYVPAPDDLRKN